MKIPETEAATPDYRISVGGDDVFVEIKQIDQDDAFGIGAGSRTPGSHVAKKIHQARRQLQPVSREGSPSVLLIYNNVDPMQLFGTEDHDFTAAMYGDLTVVLGKLGIEDMYHGLNASLGVAKNTSFSAVGCLRGTPQGPSVRLYENAFAKNRLDFDALPDCFEIVRIPIGGKKCETPQDEDPKTNGPERVGASGLSPTAILVVSGVIIGPLWFGTLALVGIFVEEVLGWKKAYHGPKWIPGSVAIVLFGVGFFLWKIAVSVIGSRWGRRTPESLHSR